jgi:hypothetical protein
MLIFCINKHYEMFGWIRNLFSKKDSEEELNQQLEDFEDENNYDIVIDTDDNFNKQICMQIIEDYCIANALALSRFNASYIETETFTEYERYISNEILRIARDLKKILNEDTFELLTTIYGSEAIVIDTVYTRILRYYMMFRFGFNEEPPVT